MQSRSDWKNIFKDVEEKLSLQLTVVNTTFLVFLPPHIVVPHPVPLQDPLSTPQYSWIPHGPLLAPPLFLFILSISNLIPQAQGFNFYPLAENLGAPPPAYTSSELPTYFYFSVSQALIISSLKSQAHLPWFSPLTLSQQMQSPSSRSDLSLAPDLPFSQQLCFLNIPQIQIQPALYLS